jgi:hypothetical protein
LKRQWSLTDRFGDLTAPPDDRILARMDGNECPRCECSVDAGDHYCRDCGWSLRLPPIGEATLVSGVPMRDLSVLPALRADLAPVVPTIRRGATVIAVAVVADWALRTGGRALLREGMALLGQGQGAGWGPPRWPAGSNGASRPDIIVVEQRVTIRKDSTS